MHLLAVSAQLNAIRCVEHIFFKSEVRFVIKKSTANMAHGCVAVYCNSGANLPNTPCVFAETLLHSRLARLNSTPLAGVYTEVSSGSQEGKKSRLIFSCWDGKKAVLPIL